MSESAPKPLGPGDEDPRSPAAASDPVTSGPLGPGDDDPRSPAKGSPVITAGPLGPGESTNEDDGEERVMLAPAPPGPGDAASGPRHVTHVPKRKPTVVATPASPVDATAAPEPEEMNRG